MKRREFVKFLGGAATIVWPYASRAQQTKVARIGVLVLGAPDPEQFFVRLTRRNPRGEDVERAR
jgi:hypothetical protein